MDLIPSSPEGLRGLVGWVHGHAASCGALPSLQKTLSSEYCGVIRAVWGCDQGHDYTMDTDPSCGALLLDSALAVKWTWDKEVPPRLAHRRRSNPTGAAAPSPQGRATAAWAETEPLPGTGVARPPSDSSPEGPGPSPLPQPGLPPSGAPGRRLLWAVGPGLLLLSRALSRQWVSALLWAAAACGCLTCGGPKTLGLQACGGAVLCRPSLRLLSPGTEGEKNGPLLWGVGEQDGWCP